MSDLKDEFLSVTDLSILEDLENVKVEISFDISQTGNGISTTNRLIHQLQEKNENYKISSTMKQQTSERHTTTKICDLTGDSVDHSVSYNVYVDQNNGFTLKPDSFSSAKVADESVMTGNKVANNTVLIEDSVTSLDEYDNTKTDKNNVIPPPDQFEDKTEIHEERNVNSETFFPDLEKHKIAILIQQLILEKYKENLLKIKLRSLEHHNLLKRSTLCRKNIEENALGKFAEHSLEKISSTQNTDEESTDSGLNNSDDETRINKSEEYVSASNEECNSYRFLQEVSRNEVTNINESDDNSEVRYFICAK